MFIERLEFGEEMKYSALESAIHLGRYLLAKQYCRDMKVLDIACGEGYGTFAMADKWGAKEVCGVDISKEAIEKANKNFKTKNTTFYNMDAETNSSFFEEKSFDLIVSFETIEHLANPAAYLQNLKKWVKDDGIIIISCPNDNWYYDTPDKANPFHERKYTFNEFSSLCETELGRARGYMFGMPTSGFSNININSSLLSKKDNISSMFEATKPEVALLPSVHNINETNVSYFVGVWGPDEIGVQNTTTVFGTSMDESRVIAYSDYIKITEEILTFNKVKQELKAEIKQLNLKAEELLKEVDLINRKNKKLSLAVKGTNKENEYLKHNIWVLQNDKPKTIQDLNIVDIQNELESLLNSKSWKVTAPLRKIFGLLRR